MPGRCHEKVTGHEEVTGPWASGGGEHVPLDLGVC